MRIVYNKGNGYIVNGMKVVADNVKEAISEYLSVHGAGANVIFQDKDQHVEMHNVQRRRKSRI